MNRYGAYRKSDGKYLHSQYEAIAVDYTKTVGEAADSNLAIHLIVPIGTEARTQKAVLSGEDYILEDDAAEITKKRDRKLNKLRIIRSQKLIELDNMYRDLQDGTRVDSAAVHQYRQDLKDITNDYKNHSTDGAHATAIDALDVDAAGTWPTKP